MSFKRFLSGTLTSLMFSGAEPLCNLKEGSMGNIHVKLYEIWTKGQGEMWFKAKVYGRRTMEDGRRTMEDGRRMTDDG